MEKTLKKYFGLFALPGIVCFLVAFLIPMFMGIYLSFCEFRNLSDVEWVGIKNYIDAFTIDNNFSSALLFTVCFPGAPAVKARFWSKSLNPFVKVINTQMVIEGITAGILILNNVFQYPAPSILAASNISVGIF